MFRILLVELARRKKFIADKKTDTGDDSDDQQTFVDCCSEHDMSVCEGDDPLQIDHLPEEVMLHILSWLPLRYAAQAARGRITLSLYSWPTMRLAQITVFFEYITALLLLK